MARISAWRSKVQLPELHIPAARSGILKILPGTSVGKSYLISTLFSTKTGASGSALGTGNPAALAPAVPQPELSQSSQFVRRAPFVVFTPAPPEVRFAWLHT